MNIMIFGANGGIGKWAVKHALQNGHNVTAYVRDSSKTSNQDKNLTVIQGEVTDAKKITEEMAGQDAVIWCVGIPMKKNYARMESLAGHKTLIKAMKSNRVKRLVDWGTPSIHFEKDKKSFVTVAPGIMAGLIFTQAKKEMVAIGEMIKKSDLEWTIVRFMAPKDTLYTGKVKVGFGDIKMKFAISREDIGAFMVKTFDSDEFIHSMPIIGS